MLLVSSDDFRTRERKQVILLEKSPHWAKAYKVACDVIKERKQGIKQKLKILKNQLELERRSVKKGNSSGSSAG